MKDSEIGTQISQEVDLGQDIKCVTQLTGGDIHVICMQHSKNFVLILFIGIRDKFCQLYQMALNLVKIGFHVSESV
jgi:hypothetical protein